MKRCILNNITTAILLLVFSLTSCSSIKKNVDFKDYKNIEPFIDDYLNTSYLDSYVKDYDIFRVEIDSIQNDYFLINIYPFNSNVTLNSSEFSHDDLFPQGYKEVKEKTFFIDFIRKRPSDRVYTKLLEKNKIDSTYILVEQGKLSEDEGIIIDKYDDSIFAQNYLVKRKFNKLKLIYQWYGGKVIYINNNFKIQNIEQ